MSSKYWQVTKLNFLHKFLTSFQITKLTQIYHKVCSKIIDKYEVESPKIVCRKVNINDIEELTGIKQMESIKIVDSFGNYCKDVNNNIFLDMNQNNGNNVLGYNHRTISSKVKLEYFQQGLVNTFNETPSLEYVNEIKHLLEFAPGTLNHVHVNQNYEIVMENTLRLACLSYLSKNDKDLEKYTILTFNGGKYQNNECTQVEFPNICHPYIENSIENQVEEERVLEELKKKIFELQSNGVVIPALIIEPIQFEAGVRYASPTFYRSILKICKDENICSIIDETYTCGWVTGRKYAYLNWVSEIDPDFVIFGGRMQLSGCFYKSDIIDVENLEKKNISIPHFDLNVDTAKLNYLLLLNKEVYDRDWLDLHSNDFISSVKTEINEIKQKSKLGIHNFRGVGKMFAFDVEHRLLRDEIVSLSNSNGFKVGASGDKTLIFTPSLLFTEVHFTHYKDFLINIKPTTQYFSRI